MPPSWLNSIKGIYSDGAIKTINGVKFGCVPYLCDDLLEFAECDILLTHVPPAKTSTSKRSSFVGISMSQNHTRIF